MFLKLKEEFFDNKSKSNQILLLVLMTILFFQFSTFTHKTLKLVMRSPHIDFAYNYFHASQINKGIEVFTLSIDETENLMKSVDYVINGGRAGYHPIIFLLTIPFTFFSIKKAYLLWSFFHLILYFSSAFLLYVICKTFHKEKSPQSNLLSFFFIFFSFFSFWPFFEHILLGQLEIPVLFLLTYALFLRTKKQFAWEAALVTFTIFIKPQYCVLMLFYIIFPRRSTFKGIFATTIIVNVIAGLFIGFHQVLLYFHGLFFVWPQKFVFSYGSVINHSFQGFFIRLLGTSTVSTWLISICYLITLFFLIITVKKAKTRKITDQQEYLLFALTVVIQHLLSPYVQHHYLVVMLLPIIVLSHALFNTINLTTKDYIQFILLFTFLSLQASPVSFRSFYHGPKSVAFALPLIGIIFTALLLKKVLLADQEISKTITT